MTLPDAITALPCWTGTPAGEPLQGGLSNVIWRVTDAAGDHVVRLGRDYPFHHVDRAREAMVARAAHAGGFGPAVEHVAPGVMVTRFVTARTWGAADMRADPARVAGLLRRFHHDMPLRVEGAAFLFWPFHVIRDYLQQLARVGDAAQIAGWQALNAALEGVQPPLPLVFGHHDLLPANILDDGDRLWLIDFEYAGFGTCLFDLASVASNAGMSGEEARALLTAYLGHAPDAVLARAFDAMQVASLLREMLWAHVSARHLSAPGADYAAYAADCAARLAATLDIYQTTHGKIAP